MLVEVACIFVGCINFCVLILDEYGDGKLTTTAILSFSALIRFVALEAIGHSAMCLKNTVNFFTNITLCQFLTKLQIAKERD